MAARTTIYRGHRIHSAPYGPGWRLRIVLPRRGGNTVLRNRVPRGLPQLLAEAKLHVDRLLDGAAWQRAP